MCLSFYAGLNHQRYDSVAQTGLASDLHYDTPTELRVNHRTNADSLTDSASEFAPGKHRDTRAKIV